MTSFPHDPAQSPATPRWLGRPNFLPMKPPRRRGWLAALVLLAAVWAVCALATAARQVSFEPTDNARYTAWALRPEFGAFCLACVVAVLAAGSQLRRRPRAQARLAVLLAALLAGIAVVAAGVTRTHSREHLAGAVQRAATEVSVRGGVPAGDARSVGDVPNIVEPLAAPIWVRTWRGSWPALPDCDQVTELPRGWRQGVTPCTFLRGDGLVQVFVGVSSDPDGTAVVQVKAQPAFP